MSKYSAARDLDLQVKTKWYLIASRTDALIYKEGSDRRARLVEALSNPEGRLKESELASDRPGKTLSSAPQAGMRHGLDRGETQRDRSAKLFAEKIAKLVAEGQREERFGELIVAAEPHFLGVVWAELSDNVKRSVRHKIAREYVHAPESEIRSKILHAISQQEEESAA
jgi:protein required for attachment to host cells